MFEASYVVPPALQAMYGDAMELKCRRLTDVFANRQVGAYILVMANRSAAETSSVEATAELNLAVLCQIAQTLSAGQELAGALGEVLQVLSDKRDMPRGMVVLLDESTGKLRTLAATGFDGDKAEPPKHALGEGITGNVTATGRARIVRDLRAEKDSPDRDIRLGVGAEPVSYLCLPVAVSGRTVGALAVYKVLVSDQQLLTDQALLEIVSAMLGQAIRIDRMVVRQKDQLFREYSQIRAQVRDRYRF
jgi:transcriptional regulator with GAF, ATPase, and Fis domain